MTILSYNVLPPFEEADVKHEHNELTTERKLTVNTKEQRKGLEIGVI